MLARTLGRTLHELCETMTAAEFGLWLEEYRRDPWGGHRDGLHAAIVAKAVADYAGKIRNSPAELEEFLLRFEPLGETVEPDPIDHFKQMK